MRFDGSERCKFANLLTPAKYIHQQLVLNEETMSVNPQPATRSDRFKSLLGNAAKLAQKQAALTKINSVSLPKVYRDIGKRIVALKNLPADLVPFRDKITQLENSKAVQPEPPKADGTSGFAAKAKQLAVRASKAAGDAAAAVQLQAAYVALGKQAIEKYGEKAIPKEVVGEYGSLVTQRDGLKSEIELLASASGLGAVTPKRLAIAGVVVCLLLGVVFVRSASSWLFGGGGLPRNVSDQVARATSGIGRSVDALKAELERDKARMQTESRNRELQEREITVQQREREMQEREKKAQEPVAQKTAPTQSTGGRRTAVQSEPVVEITNLRESMPLLLVDNSAFFNLQNDFRNRLVSYDFPKDVRSLTTPEKNVPKSPQDALERYKKALAALQKCPVLASLQINEPMGKGRFSANWQGQTCVFESTGPSFTRGSRHNVPVTCAYAVSYTEGGQSCSDHPYLVQAGDATSDEVAQGKKYADNLKDELDAVLLAGQWIVYFGAVGLPADAAQISDADIAKQASFEGGLPRAKEMIEAIRGLATGAMTRDAPALYYALRCASCGMLTDAARRKHATNTQIDSESERLVLPAASAIQWATWFRNYGPQEEQVGTLECLNACGAKWNEQDDGGRTPLVHAMLAKHKHSIEYLCEKGWGVSKRDAEGRTPLMSAVLQWDDAFKPLLSVPGAIDGVDKNGDSVLHYCDRYFSMPVLSTMKILVDKGASVTLVNKAGDTPLHTLARFATAGLDVGDDNGKSWMEAILFFISKGADGSAINAKGETPVGILSRVPMPELTTGFLFPEAVVVDAEGHKGKHRAIVLKDKSVLWAEDRGNRRTVLIKRSQQGKVVAQQTLEGSLASNPDSVDACNVLENLRGNIFITVERGNAEFLICLSDALKPRWESTPVEKILSVALQPDDSVVMMCDSPGGGNFLKKIAPDGQDVWASKETGPLKMGKSFPEDGPGCWASAPNGVFAFQLPDGPIGPYTMMSMGGDGTQRVGLQHRVDIAITGVLSDGALLVQSPNDENEAGLIGPDGKARWRLPLGVCFGICELRSGSLAVSSQAGDEARVTVVDKAGGIIWQVVLENCDGRLATIIQEAADGTVLVVGEGHSLWVIDREGHILAVTQYPFLAGHGSAEFPRVFTDGTVVWPSTMGGFISGNFKKWPK